ncbi:MAG: alpha/beta hydrolase [Acidimicrobiales bacterium]|nr:alpha/beta hydrolase [Acidimicrobiales bacterium]
MSLPSRTTERFTTRSGIQIEADLWGEPSNNAAVFLHGGGQTRHSWGSTATTIANQGWFTVSLDLRGHGGSDWAKKGEYGLNDFAEDVLSVLQELEICPVVIGASLGGLAGMYLSGQLKSNSIRSLVLVDVVPRMNPQGADRVKAFMQEHIQTGFATLEEAAEAIATYNPQRRKPSDLTGLKKNLHQRNGRWFWHWDPAFIEMAGTEKRLEMQNPDLLTSVCKAVKVPILLIRGRLSDLVTEVEAEEFINEFPEASFVDVSGAGHMVAGDQNDVFTDAVAAFLQTTS